MVDSVRDTMKKLLENPTRIVVLKQVLLTLFVIKGHLDSSHVLFCTIVAISFISSPIIAICFH